MIFKKINIYFIKSLSDRYIHKTIKSLYNTIPQNIEVNYTIVEELNQREETLNHILTLNKDKREILIIADDIEFIDGWFESLQSNYSKGDIIGFSTLFPDSDIVQDYGYDFVTINNKLSYKGLFKNENINKVNIDKVRVCDSVCGCAMFIKGEVLNNVKEFPLDGNNRIGEMIYSKLAKDKGFKTIVLDKFLYHGGISTKTNKDINLSSISWLIEKDNWGYNVKKYFKDVNPKLNYTRLMSKKLINYLNKSKQILVYGCGTIADFILGFENDYNFDICSGLKEEIGKKFHEKIIMNVNKVDKLKYDLILITPVGYEDFIKKEYFSNIETKFIIENNNKNNLEYNIN